MITKVVLTDDEQGEFTYEREPGSYDWTMTWPSGNKSQVETNTGDVLYQVAAGVTEGAHK